MGGGGRPSSAHAGRSAWVLTLLAIDGKRLGEGFDLGANLAQDLFARWVIQNVCNEVGGHGGFLLSKTTRCHGRGSNANTTRDHGLFRVVGDGVFIGGQVR